MSKEILESLIQREDIKKRQKATKISSAVYPILFDMFETKLIGEMNITYEQDPKLKSINEYAKQHFMGYTKVISHDTYVTESLHQINIGIRFLNKIYGSIDDVHKFEQLKNKINTPKNTITLKKGQSIKEARKEWEEGKRSEVPGSNISDYIDLAKIHEDSQTIDNIKQKILSERSELNQNIRNTIKNYIDLSSIVYLSK